MTTQNEDQDFVQTDWFDPFPEPHTIPAGWDISKFFPPRKRIPLKKIIPTLTANRH